MTDRRSISQKRRAIPAQMKVDALLWRFTINCRLCTTLLNQTDEIEWDHVTPLALHGTHSFDNIAPVHKACHRAKTVGMGATTAGSDIGRIKKMRHILTGKMAVHKPLHEAAFDVNLAAAFGGALRRSAKVVHKAKRKSKYKRKVSGETVLRDA